jgi:thermitase
MNATTYNGSAPVHSGQNTPIRQGIFALPVPLVAAGLIAAASLGALAQPSGHVPGQLLVKPRFGAAEATVQALFRQHSARQTHAIHQINVRILQVPEARLERTLAVLSANPNIEFAEVDYLLAPEAVPNDPYCSMQWHLSKIATPTAWEIATGSNSVIIAVLDTGVETTHTDLASALVPGWNFYDNNSNTADVTGHGTGVAGAAAAVGNNGIGVASVAWGCKIMPIRVSDTSGNASFSVIANALTWASDHGARVANVSFRASDSSTVSSAAQYFQSRGGVVAVAAGNESLFGSTPDNPCVLTVSASDSNDTLASFSNTGSNIDLSAPGVNILTTATGGSYGYGTGTSFSAPVVAGVAALMISANPSLTGTQVRDILEQSADDLGAPGWDTSYGWGRVNASKAVLAAVAGAPITTPPTVQIMSPPGGCILSNVVTISVNASGPVGVTMLQCYLNGTCVGTNTMAPAAFSWDTTRYANGSYTLQALAVDASGNAGTSSVVTVAVQNPLPDTTPPSATITAPTSGSTVVGTVSVNVSATDNVGVTRVEWYLSGTLMANSSAATVSFPWNTTNYANGSYTLQARAYDAAGNIGASPSLSVTVQNSVPIQPKPIVRITSPANGAQITLKTTPVNVVATDSVAIKQVNLLVDGKSYATSSSSTPLFNWNTSKLSKGSHTLQAVARDAAGVSASSAVVTVYK